MNYGVEHSNDLTDGVVTRRDGYLFTIGVRDHIGGIHIVEHERVWSQQNIDGSDVEIPIVVGVDPFDRAVGGWALNEHGITYDLFFYTSDTYDNTNNSVNKCPY